MTVPALPSYPEASQATTALILGIFGILCCGLLGIAAWVMGNNELAAISSGRRDPVNAGTARAARIIGIIGTVLIVLPIIIFSVGGIGSMRVPFLSP